MSGWLLRCVKLDAGPDRLHGGQGPRAALREALVVGSQAPVMAYGRQRGHVDHGAQLRPAALADRCAARVLAAFPSRRLQAGERRCFRHQLLLPRPYLVLTKPLRLDIQCQRGASVKIGWKCLDD